MSFSALGLSSALVGGCQSLGYTTPTPIQKQAIPLILAGTDLIGCADTGTGKTAAFLLPLIHKLTDVPAAGVQALILAPTRELAAQIAQSLQALDVQKTAPCAVIVGGVSLERQKEALRRRPRVVVATPGRLLDHLERGSLTLSHVQFLVLDEADRMLDMGFWPAMRRILAQVPSRRQTLLFSATMSRAIEDLARSTMKQPQLVEVSPRGQAAPTVEQTAYPVALNSKTALLIDLLEQQQLERVLVFTRTRRGAERLSHILSARGHEVNRIHADRTQPQREAALRGFSKGRTRVLVATDIAARGIDVASVTHVINFDVPEAPEDYVHRIGRTGRAGNTGHSITLVTPADELSMRAIERLTGKAVRRVHLPTFGGAAAPPTFAPEAAAAKPLTRHRGAAGRRSFRPRRASR